MSPAQKLRTAEAWELERGSHLAWFLNLWLPVTSLPISLFPFPQPVPAVADITPLRQREWPPREALLFPKEMVFKVILPLGWG